MLARQTRIQWPEGTSGTTLLGIMGLVIALVVVWRLVLMVVHLWKLVKPYRPFLKVAGKLNLRWEDRFCLIMIARESGLATPLSLLICSSTLRSYAQQCQEKLDKKKALRVQRCVDQVSRQLF